MSRAGRLTAVGLLLAASGCVTQDVTPRPDWEFVGDGPQVAIAPGPRDPQAGDDEDLLSLLGEPATAADLGPDFLADQPPSPFHRLGRNVIRGIDGSWTKIYSLRSGRSHAVVDLLRSYVPDFPTEPNTPHDPDASPAEVIRYSLHENFYRDEMSLSFGERQNMPETQTTDALHVTAPPETLLFIDELLHRVLADLPQVELQVRVVEINLSDALEWDARMLARDLVDPTLPFDPDTNPPSGKFGGGQPIFDGGDPTGAGAAFSSITGSASLPGFLVSLQGVHGDLAVDAVLSLLQTIGATEIISSPTITVLNGHRARLLTGDRLPVFSATGSVINPNVTTTFEQTGVEIELVPFIVSENLMRIDLSLRVSSQTGSEPFVLSGTEVSSPIISTRSAGTTVHVYDQQVFAVGGLRASNQIETITKVPLLGDIPILGWLFKSRRTQKQNTEILFFVTPIIRIPSETLINPLGS